MSAKHPMQPPSELIAQAITEARNATPDFMPDRGSLVCAHVARTMYAAGADAQLEECVEWLEQGPYGASITVNHVTENLRAAMRPKPPTLKEQALAFLETRSLPVMLGTPQYNLTQPQVEIIRKALEQLPNE